MILLDTNICIYIINAKPSDVLERFTQYRMGEVGLPYFLVGNSGDDDD